LQRASREGAKIAPATLRKYQTFTKQLTAFADSHGYVMLNQFTSGDIDVFYSGWNLDARSTPRRLLSFVHRLRARICALPK